MTGSVQGVAAFAPGPLSVTSVSVAPGAGGELLADACEQEAGVGLAVVEHADARTGEHVARGGASADGRGSDLAVGA